MTITLAVTERDKKTTTDSLRANGKVPAVVYGPKQEPISIALEAAAFDKVRKEAGESTLVELSGLSKSIEVLIKGVDFNPLKQQVVHVDFYAVEKGKAITTHIKLEFIGEAPVEESKVGVLNKVLHEIEVTCKPVDLPNHIDVDLSTLVGLEDKILVKDLVIPSGVTVDTEGEDPIVVVSAARVTTEDEDAATEAVDMDSIEVEQKGKVEEGEAEEK
ncbi:50S ribosomal protein L25 [Candidatus Nomurabacteria bacterium]|nr:50S ribosomal protein L25 [Candidatus Kaiserbacteria bacterium]MCB9815064.1 50S ribosomal protein L25 [Candidatus Nomurabacteria bacterium]